MLIRCSDDPWGQLLVHREVLCKYSPYFRAMLSSAWHEPLTVTNADGSSKELWVLDLTFDFELSMSYLAFEVRAYEHFRRHEANITAIASYE